jgi:hypothetical protein
LTSDAAENASVSLFVSKTSLLDGSVFLDGGRLRSVGEIKVRVVRPCALGSSSPHSGSVSKFSLGNFGSVLNRGLHCCIREVQVRIVVPSFRVLGRNSANNRHQDDNGKLFENKQENLIENQFNYELVSMEFNLLTDLMMSFSRILRHKKAKEIERRVICNAIHPALYSWPR